MQHDDRDLISSASSKKPSLPRKHSANAAHAAFAELRCNAKTYSILTFFFQIIVLYLILGPWLGKLILEMLWAIFPQLLESDQITTKIGQEDFLPSFGELAIGSPLGFALSLLVDWHKAPLQSCLPFAWLTKSSKHSKLSRIPNRVFYAQPGDTVRMFWGRQRSKLYWFFLSLLGGLAFILCSNMLVRGIRLLFPLLPTYQINVIDQIFARLTIWQSFFIIVVQPVIFEELVFRGRGYTLLARTWGSSSALWFSSLLFALVHVSPVEVLSLLPLSFYLGWLRKRSGSLAYTMVVHLQNNGLAFYALLFSGQ